MKKSIECLWDDRFLEDRWFVYYIGGVFIGGFFLVSMLGQRVSTFHYNLFSFLWFKGICFWHCNMHLFIRNKICNFYCFFNIDKLPLVWDRKGNVSIYLLRFFRSLFWIIGFTKQHKWDIVKRTVLNRRSLIKLQDYRCLAI